MIPLSLLIISNLKRMKNLMYFQWEFLCQITRLNGFRKRKSSLYKHTFHRSFDDKLAFILQLFVRSKIDLRSSNFWQNYMFR